MCYLTLYWLIFWQRFIRNPYLLSTSEIASTNFPHWIWIGRKWRMKDNLYYNYPAYIPFLSMWYWPNVIVSKLSRYLSLDRSFRLYVYFILFHYLIGSFISYKLFGLFGAITLTYSAYCIKPQTPSFVYTACWIPGIFLGGWFGAFSLGMAVLGGYWPILVYILPVAVLSSPSSLIGLVLASPQIITFSWYWRRSNRWGKIENNEYTLSDKRIGRVPWRKIKDLFLPTNNVKHTNGVYYPETEMYMGIAMLFIWNVSWWWIGAIIALAICVGLIPPVQRIPSRALYLLTFCIVFLTFPNPQGSPIYYWAVILIQSFLLLRNSSIYPSFPFSQWWDKPSKIYPSVDYTGYLTNSKIHDYKGGFSLKC